jgi:hypothetical protein
MDSEDDKVKTKNETQEVEEVIVFMFNAKDIKSIKITKFKGEVQKLPICALLDSESTHSFVNPVVLKDSEQKLIQTTTMMVIVANETRMVTD